MNENTHEQFMEFGHSICHGPAAPDECGFIFPSSNLENFVYLEWCNGCIRTCAYRCSNGNMLKWHLDAHIFTQIFRNDSLCLSTAQEQQPPDKSCNRKVVEWNDFCRVIFQAWKISQPTILTRTHAYVFRSLLVTVILIKQCFLVILSWKHG